MCNLIVSEWYKITKSKVTYVIGIVFLLMAFLQMLVFGYAEFGTDMDGVLTGVRGITVPLDGDISCSIIGIFATIFICQDFSTGSIRQIIGKGSSKVKYVLAKYITLVMAITVFMILYSLIDFVAFSLLGEIGEINQDVLLHLLVFALGSFSMILSYTAIMEFISIAFRKNTITIPLSVMFLVVGSIITQVLYYITENENMYKYWLVNMSANFGNFEIGINEKLTYIVILVIVAIVFNGLSSFIFQKWDVE